MKSLSTQLINYAAYHRNPNNILTHFIGIPMIVLSVAIILAHPLFYIGQLAITPTLVLVIIASSYYLCLDFRLGLAMCLFLFFCYFLSNYIVQLFAFAWLIVGAGLFIVGWIIQFIGHFFEGRKPAFIDDIMGLAIGPLFVMAELSFLLNMRLELKQEIEAAFTVKNNHQ
ncbi:Mpo1-like protein [Pseudomonas sp. F1_0610]|uniref:Mpo1 family 2-hydroxy fatty acid dioxygenase n=1 Tax=Pseudomonas sp. F1_0610 TaxID=3114284 RepID=UPI0039C25199